ncbi:MAG: GIY-YIG nuclease family protein, partial [Pseudomonadota bacterium]
MAQADPISGQKLIGHALIADEVRRLPARPGVYRMLGKEGEVLYVGKARSLKSRVANYATLNGHANRIARMISETRSMEFVVTDTETEALLLEANLIKQLRPRYNVLLRDNKSFASRRSASVSVSVTTNSIDRVSEIIRAM